MGNNFKQRDLKSNLKVVGNFMARYYLLIALVLLIVAGIFLSDKFLTTKNILNVLLQNSMLAIFSMGMLFVIITGGIDLSVGSIVALSACLIAGSIQNNINIFLGLLMTISILAVVGVFTGALVSFGKIAPFIATLAMMTIIRGAAYIYQVGSDRRIDGTILPKVINSSIGFVPIPIIIMIFIVGLSAFILSRTVFGRAVYAIGGNYETARLAGINVKMHLIVVYVISAVFASISGIILAGRLSLGTALVGTGYELDGIAAVVVGGASLMGGSGTVLNTLMGAFILGFLSNIMNLMGVAAYPQMITKGFIILIAVLVKRD